MNLLSEFWLKVAGLAAIASGLLVWRQKGISDAVGHEKAKNRIIESKNHIEKIEKERADAKTAHEIRNTVSQLDDDDVSERLRSFRE